MLLLDHAPHYPLDEAASLARELYGLDARATALPSERDQNFLLHTEGGDAYVLKIANSQEDPAFLAAQNQVMALLHARGMEVCQQVFPAQDGQTLVQVTAPTGARHWVRLVSYLPGRPLGSVPHHGDELLRDLGARLGELDVILTDFDHPALQRTFHWDLAQARPVLERHAPEIADASLRKLVQTVAQADLGRLEPLLPQLPRSPIHNDANDYNVLVGGGVDPYTRNQRVTGLIDFGDMVHSYTVADLAVAAAYALLDKPDPLAAACQVVAGYHPVRPLTDEELAALFGFIRLRLCMSVAHAAHQQAQRPDDPYLSISQAPIRRTLPKLARIHPRFAEAAFRAACGLVPVPAGEEVRAWLTAHQERVRPVLGRPLSPETVHVLDLSASSPLVHGDPAHNTADELGERIRTRLAERGAQVGVGRYDEARTLYSGPAFEPVDGRWNERRTIHLGMDLFAPPGTPVHAPLAGTVHALADNPAPQDYGPVVILRHEPQDGPIFYSIYGHLSRTSLAKLRPGQPVSPGEAFATLGAPEENGGWPPHLHLQIAVDLLDRGCDFPGVCSPAWREVWTSFSPDANLLVGLPETCFPPSPPDKAATLAIRRRRIGRNLSIGYRDPVKIVRGWRQHLYDDQGRPYLDAYNNVPHVGHCHPRVVRAAHEQMAVLNTNTRYLHDGINRLAERLTATLPDPLQVCFFLNSASEANELALRLVRAYTGSREMIVLEGAYHGHTTGLIDISPYKHDGPGGQGAPDWVHTAPIADVYRGPYKADDPLAGEKYAAHVADIIRRLEGAGRKLGGFIAESCPSVGGQIFFPPGYLDAVYRHVRAAGGVCIADEVQTGYGRIGTHFYAFEAQGVVPDIVVLGKPIGNGHPLAAVVTTPEIADAFDNGMEFFSTFGGNTVSCAVGLAVLDVVQEEGLQAHAYEVGKQMLAAMVPWVERFPLVGDVRGSGLFLGVELVQDRETLEPAAAEASYVANRMREEGILLGTDGPLHNVVKIRPPMPFTAADGAFLVETMERILEELQ